MVDPMVVFVRSPDVVSTRFLQTVLVWFRPTMCVRFWLTLVVTLPATCSHWSPVSFFASTPVVPASPTGVLMPPQDRAPGNGRHLSVFGSGTALGTLTDLSKTGIGSLSFNPPLVKSTCYEHECVH